jgi:hypothetical protein
MTLTPEQLDPRLLLTHCRIEREICADVIVTGIPTVKGLDKLIEILIMLRNDWNQVTDQSYVNYDTAAIRGGKPQE